MKVVHIVQEPPGDEWETWYCDGRKVLEDYSHHIVVEHVLEAIGVEYEYHYIEVEKIKEEFLDNLEDALEIVKRGE